MNFYLKLLLGLLLLLTACSNPFNPPQDAEDNPSDPMPLTSPENCLKNLEIAYRQQDIDIYAKCLSDSFRFVLLRSDASAIGVDMNGDGTKDDWWGFQQEMEYHRNLFKEGSSDGLYAPPNSIDLNLIIPPKDAWKNETQIGMENTYLIPCSFDLRLHTYSSQEITATGQATFYVRLENGEWKIFIWQDESNI